jgi:hypothetical protein
MTRSTRMKTANIRARDMIYSLCAIHQNPWRTATNYLLRHKPKTLRFHRFLRVVLLVAAMPRCVQKPMML